MANGSLSMRGSLGIRRVSERKVSLTYKLRNLPAISKGWLKWQIARTFGIATLYGTLHARVLHADGAITNYGLISTRVVTTAFVNKLAAALVASDAGLVNFDFHAGGTGTTAEAVGDTALVTATADARATGTASNPTANQYRSVGTQTYAAAAAITEHGLLDASTGGTLMDRSVFAAVNVAAGEKIEYTYTLTVQAGG